MYYRYIIVKQNLMSAVDCCVLAESSVLGFSKHSPSFQGSHSLPACVDQARPRGGFTMNKYTQLQLSLSQAPPTSLFPTQPSPVVIHKQPFSSSDRWSLALRLAKRDIALSMKASESVEGIGNKHEQDVTSSTPAPQDPPSQQHVTSSTPAPQDPPSQQHVVKTDVNELLMRKELEVVNNLKQQVQKLQAEVSQLEAKKKSTKKGPGIDCPQQAALQHYHGHIPPELAMLLLKLNLLSPEAIVPLSHPLKKSTTSHRHKNRSSSNQKKCKELKLQHHKGTPAVRASRTTAHSAARNTQFSNNKHELRNHSSKPTGRHPRVERLSTHSISAAHRPLTRHHSMMSEPAPSPPHTGKPSPTPPHADKLSPTPPHTDKPSPTPPHADKLSPTPPHADKPSPTPPHADKPSPTPPHADKPSPTPPHTDKPAQCKLPFAAKKETHSTFAESAYTVLERLEELEAETEVVRTKWQAVTQDDLSPPTVIAESPKEHTESSLSRGTIDRVNRNRKRYARYLELTGTSTSGGFDPWAMAERIADELMTEVLADVADEVECVCNSCIDCLYRGEFRPPTQTT